MTAKAKLNNGHGFWNFNLGHALTITVIVFSVIAAYFGMDARVSAVEDLASKTALRLERIDEHGTRKSQLGMSQEMELLRSHSNRIDKLEEVVGILSPKIERIDVNIQWIMNHQTQVQLQLQQQQRHTGR